mmetsp:Transcript_3821/g.6004  ORF Transcript_3821/g.6004 Transcript_3821/m.6004 type:complete len:447 (-) Transcript_3821:1680-3020(-)|eukprot:CAMPEP_0178933166 /NCGR_PEP_ID=MMETSP0786-20121207/23098_1 /TAXON_ID=186022 /ORGANISM="Thalassionema frauenfeldii, Strain CCMP 1798" /LENGTH=446 /DNA_ID=CAMNT_0020610691 /DNA_START=98 /DNA_END=1438 /DNA_ORIENTATION=+
MERNTDSNLQRYICNAIAKLPDDSCEKTVADVLDYFKEAANLRNEKKYAFSDDGDGVTPLMMACDKGQSSCLEYMAKNKSFSFLWGSSDDRSALQFGSNTALHHAGMSGTLEALVSVPSIGSCSLLELLSIGNAHGDTPVMMACVYDRLRFLKKIKEMICRDNLMEMFRTKNESGETALSLAMGHGHVEIIQWLLDVGVTPCYETVQQCKIKQQIIDDAIEGMPSCNEEIELKRSNMRRCLVRLEIALARIAQDAMEKLLIEEEETSRDNERSRNDISSKHCLKEMNNQSHQKSDQTLAPDQKDPAYDLMQFLQSKLDASKPIFKTLSDGTVVTAEVNELETTPVDPVRIEIVQPKSADQMLRERFREPTVTTEMEDTSIDAYMDSLCLDASMLLMNSHEMAMNLSPSQLEAINRILHKQMQAVKDAQAIQKRVLQNTNAPQPGHK